MWEMSKLCRLLKVESHEGTVPVRQAFTAEMLSGLSFSKERGSGPLSRLLLSLLLTSKPLFCMKPMLAMLRGIEPVSWLKDKSGNEAKSNFPKKSGIVPTKELCARLT